MIHVGIDPGSTGAVAALDEAGRILHLKPMPMTANEPNVVELYHLVADVLLEAGDRDVSIALEKAQAMPDQGVSSMFRYGYSTGMVHAACRILLPKLFVLVAPRTWQASTWSAAGVTGSLEPKEKSLQAATRLFADADLKASSRCKVPHKGMVDALLIAEWLRRSTK